MKSLFALFLVVAVGGAAVAVAAGGSTRFTPPTVKECVTSVQIYLSAIRAHMSVEEYHAEMENWFFFKNSYAGYVKKYKEIPKFRANVFFRLVDKLRVSGMSPKEYKLTLNTFGRLDRFLLLAKTEEAISMIGKVLKKVVI